MSARPYVWEMLKEAVENLGGRARYSEIRNYIQNKYGDVKKSTIDAHIQSCTVNNPSRKHYQRNKKPRIANKYIDFLFKVDRGLVELYDSNKHGIWEIKEDEYGTLTVGQSGIETLVDEEERELEQREDTIFPLERHLRDFIAKNIINIRVNNKQLTLFTDENGRDGVEYPTEEVGFIDILAVDEDKNFVVFELKLSKGSDRALGQIQRYMGWVKASLAQDREVTGVIIGKDISKKLKYATSITTNISLFEYDLIFKIRPVSINQ